MKIGEPVKLFRGNIGRSRYILPRLEESLQGRDPVAEVLKILDDPLVGAELKLRTWVSLFPYIYPKAKDEGSSEDTIRSMMAQMSREQLIAKLEESLAALKTA